MGSCWISNSVLVPRVLVAVGDLRLVAVPHEPLRARVTGPRGRVRIVLIVGRLRRDRLLVDVVGVVAEEARVRVVLLVRLYVLTYGDTMIHLQLGRRLRLCGGDGLLHHDRDLLRLRRLRLRRLGLRYLRDWLGWLGFGGRRLRRIRDLGRRRLLDLVGRRDLERLLLVDDHPAHAGAERGDGRLVVVEERDLVSPLSQDEVRADGRTDP
jgi:hypothetical protein